MYEHTLAQSGLNKNQAILYDILLQSGESTAGALAKQSPLKRGLTYKTLEELIELDLVEKKDEPGKVARFTPLHPLKLRELAEKRERDAKDAQSALGGVLESLVANYNLTVGKPGVQIFEGRDGIIHAYKTILAQNQPIDSIEDDGSMMKFIPDYVKEYTRERIRRKLLNRSVSPATNAINKSDPARFIEGRHLPNSVFPFSMDIKIAGDKVLFVTLKEKTAIAVLMQHEEIVRNFRILFELLWNVAGRGFPPAPVQDQPASSPTDPTPESTRRTPPNTAVQSPSSESQGAGARP
ncbi:MAG: hypothetical protein HYV34_05010 [Candidatus Kerfeldbacteria bacterium]|nr:hypothetical protein [Candidatus Kerfeldbacteria bacterium]